MSQLVFTHIETVNKRVGSSVWRVVTGAGIYDVKPGSTVAKSLEKPEYAGLLVLAVSRSSSGSGPRIVGIATRDGAHKCGHIEY